MRKISTLLVILAGMTALVHVDPAKAELSTVIDFDRPISFNSKFAIKDRLKEFDINQDFPNFLSYSNFPVEGTISLSQYYPMVDNVEVFNAFDSMAIRFIRTTN